MDGWMMERRMETVGGWMIDSGWWTDGSPTAMERLSGFMKLVNRARTRNLAQGGLAPHSFMLPNCLTPFARKLAVMLVRDTATPFTGHMLGACHTPS